MKERLDDLARRIERLGGATDPDGATMDRMLAPVLRALSWKPELRTEWLEELFTAGRQSSDPDRFLERVDTWRALLRALGEAEDNVRQLERATVVEGAAPIAHVAWCWRVYQVLSRAHEQARRAPESIAIGPWDSIAALPPLTATHASGGRELHVDSIDPLLRAAADETELLGRRRRFLEAARRLLLDSSAALELDAAGMQRRQEYIAQEIARINRLEARGLRPDVSLLHQARQALSRGEAQKLQAALTAIQGGAQRSGDGALEAVTDRALDTLWQGGSRFSHESAAYSLAASGADVFDDDVRAAVQRGYVTGRQNLEAKKEAVSAVQRIFLDRARRYLNEGDLDMTIFAALRVDGYFDVGGTLSPVRVVEEDRSLRTVRYPTQDMMLLPASGPEDVVDSIIDDPRLIMLNLATGRLLARRYVVEEVRRRERSVLSSEVRVYVLDGSGSMLGPRARMRDAILVTELATLRARYEDARRTLNPILYYRYFTKNVGPTTRVASSAAAVDAIEDVLANVHSGGTDIQAALLASFAQIREARKTDPDLSRGQIVLVTDGEAPVDAEAILEARRSLGDLPIGVSIIALGVENAALKALAASQRAAGEDVFYHFLPDSELSRILSGRDAGLPIHLPHAVNLGELSGELDRLLAELEDLTRTRERMLFDEDASQDAFAEVGLRFDDHGTEHQKARAAASRRDEAAVGARFERWFPALPASASEVVVVPGAVDQEDLDVVQTLLASTLDIIELVGTDDLARRVDAIEVLERLLLDRGMTPWRYADLCRRHAPRVGPLLLAVRAACGFEAPAAG